MADVHPEHAQLQADRIYLGWQYALLQPDPGPAPRRPSPAEEAAEQADVDPEWVRRERLNEAMLNRPVKIFRVFMTGLAGLILLLGLTEMLSWSFAALGLIATGGVAGYCTYAVHQGNRTVRHRIRERQAVGDRQRQQRDRDLFLAQEEHAVRYREWAGKKELYDRQLTWYAVTVPDEIDRIDVAGGTLPGWSALITLLGATRLYSGGHLTVLDLSEGAIAKDLIELARRGGDEPLVWVLPVDLPKLDLGATLPPRPSPTCSPTW